MNERLSTAIWMSPAAAVLGPVIVVLIASLPTVRPEDWPSVLGSLPFLAIWSFVIGYPIAMLHMLLAWPVYRWVSSQWQLRWWVAAAAGGVIGALPVTLLQAAIIFAWGREYAPDVAGGNLGLPMLFGGPGVVGGLVFWWILRGDRAEGPQP